MKYILWIFIIIPSELFSQGWEKTFGGGMDDGGYSVQQTADGGYIITGYTESFFGNGMSDVYLIKTDSNGDTLWSRTYGGTVNDYGYSVQQTADGGFIITGVTNSFGDSFSNVYLIKTDNKGDILWSKTFGGGREDYGRSVQQTTDGGYIITGATNSFGNVNYEIYLIKTDSNGDTLWSNIYGEDNNDRGFSVQQTTDGGYIITGFSYSYQHGANVVRLIKTDINGDTLWSKNYGRVSVNSYGRAVQQTTDLGYIITGTTYSTGNSVVYLIKTDSNGDTLWSKTYGRGSENSGRSVQQTTDGGYIITGYTNSIYNGDYTDVYLIKTDSNGDTLWSKTFGGDYYDYGYSVQQTADGGYIITGVTNSTGNGKDDVYLIKTDQNGIILSIIEIPIQNQNRILIKIVDFSGREIVQPEENIPYIKVYNDGTTEKEIIIK